MTPLLEISVADKRHGSKPVLSGVQLSLSAGEIVSLVGASGCGKSTLLSIGAGLDRAYRGHVLLGGERVEGPVEGIGLIFQEPRLFPWLTAAQNVSFGSAPDLARVAALLAEVGLDGYGGALPHKLSGGQAQRVAIARGLYTRPRVLLLDEPFSAVDAFTRMQLQDLLVRLAREHAVTLLMVTHDIDEALHLSDRVVLLQSGASGAALQFDVPLARPRKRGDIANAPIKNAILDRLQAVHAF